MISAVIGALGIVFFSVGIYVTLGAGPGLVALGMCLMVAAIFGNSSGL